MSQPVLFQTRPLNYLEGTVVHQDDGLEGGAASVGQLMQRLLSAPAALQQGAAHHARRAPEARAEAEGDVRGRLGAAATRQVHLEPGQRGGRGARRGDGSASGQRAKRLKMSSWRGSVSIGPTADFAVQIKCCYLEFYRVVVVVVVF